MNTQPNGEASMNFAQPPEILSTKDLLYVEDMLSWNLQAVKKANYYASVCQDRDIVQAMNRTKQLHINHYRSILNHLQKHAQTVQSQGGAMK
ncbi:MAG: hypothetical protein ABF868_09345 [Sporolactobacillus sp.]